MNPKKFIQMAVMRKTDISKAGDMKLIQKCCVTVAYHLVAVVDSVLSAQDERSVFLCSGHDHDDHHSFHEKCEGAFAFVLCQLDCFLSVSDGGHVGCQEVAQELVVDVTADDKHEEDRAF